jgi:hypothetical protein
MPASSRTRFRTRSEVSAESWGNDYDLAVKLIAAHKLAISHPEQSGPGARTYSYETPTEVDAGPWARTRYGMEYWRLLRSQAFGAMVI